MEIEKYIEKDLLEIIKKVKFVEDNYSAIIKDFEEYIKNIELKENHKDEAVITGLFSTYTAGLISPYNNDTNVFKSIIENIKKIQTNIPPYEIH